MLQAIIGRTRQCELPGEIVHRWKNPLGYDKGQITLFGFSHNSLFYEIHVKILCNSKEKKCRCGHPLSHLLYNPSDEDLYQLLGRRASHTLTDYDVSFPLKEDKNVSAKPKVSDTPTPRHRWQPQEYQHYTEHVWNSSVEAQAPTGDLNKENTQRHGWETNPPLSLPYTLREVKNW